MLFEIKNISTPETLTDLLWDENRVSGKHSIGSKAIQFFTKFYPDKINYLCFNNIINDYSLITCTIKNEIIPSGIIYQDIHMLLIELSNGTRIDKRCYDFLNQKFKDIKFYQDCAAPIMVKSKNKIIAVMMPVAKIKE